MKEIALFLDAALATILPVLAMHEAIGNRYDRAVILLLVATNCEIGYWGKRITDLLETMQ